MKILIKQQQGSFFAEVGAVITSIAILTLISTSYMDSISGKAQVAEAFILMAPMAANVNDFYTTHGEIGGTLGNYDGIDVYDNADGTYATDYAGRFVKVVQSYDNGVVMAQMNPQFSDATYAHGLVGKISNVQQSIQGEYIFLIPFLIGGTGSDQSEESSLRWSCMTTIDANPPTGDVLGVLNGTGGSEVINEQYFYAPGCVVISKTQANCLDPDVASTDFSATACAQSLQGPVNWNTQLYDIVDNTA